MPFSFSSNNAVRANILKEKDMQNLTARILETISNGFAVTSIALAGFMILSSAAHVISHVA
jgi:hypothetical protein